MVYSGILYPAEDFLDDNNGITFINCDDFPDVPTVRTNVQLRIDNLPGSISGEIVGGLYFPDLNGFMPVSPPGSTELLPSVRNVPTTLSCKAVAIAISNETIYYSIEDIITEEHQTVILDMNPVGEEQLETTLDNL